MSAWRKNVNLNSYLPPSTQLNLGWLMNLHIKGKSFLEGLGEELTTMVVDKNFLNGS